MPGREVIVAIVEHHLVGIEAAHQFGHGFAIERRADGVVADMAAGGESHFGILHMEAGIGKIAQPPAWS